MSIYNQIFNHNLFESKMIEIDRGQVKEIANLLLDNSLGLFSKYMISEEHEITSVTGDKVMQSRAPIYTLSVEDVVGDVKTVDIYWIFSPSMIPNYVLSGTATKHNNEYKIFIEFNSRKKLKGFKDKALKETISVLSHEITHIRDKVDYDGLIPNMESSDEEKGRYFNSPPEVRAFTRTYYEDIIDEVRELISSGKPPKDAMLYVLNKNPTWKYANKFYTRKNKNKILLSLISKIEEDTK